MPEDPGGRRELPARDADEQRRIRHIPPPPGLALGLAFPPSEPWKQIPPSLAWRVGAGLLAGVATGLVLDSVPDGGSAPLIAGSVVGGLGYVWALVQLGVEENRAKREHPERYPTVEPALSQQGRRLVLGVLATFLLLAGLSATALVGAGHPRRGGAVAVGLLALAIPVMAVAMWRSLRPAHPPAGTRRRG